MHRLFFATLPLLYQIVDLIEFVSYQVVCEWSGTLAAYISAVSARFVIFCTVLWPDREHCADYAASSTILRGRKPSLEVLTWLQR